MIDFRRSCERYRAVLVDFVDHAEVGPKTARALGHLERCSRCTEAMESTLLTITALRRYGDDLVPAEPGDDAWARLRARVARQPQARPSLLYPMARVVLTIGFAALLVTPIRLSGYEAAGTPIRAADAATQRAADPTEGAASSTAPATVGIAGPATTQSIPTRRISEVQGPDEVRSTVRSGPRVTPDGSTEAGKETPAAPSMGTRTWTR